MSGLLEKDLRLTLSRKQTLLIFLVAAVVMSMSMDGSFIIGYVTMLASILSIGTLSYDELDNGMSYLMTLPFARRTYVREKYLFTLLMTACAWCIGTLLYGVGSAVRSGTPFTLSELPMLLSLLPVLYLAAALMIPLQLKYGPEKSRLVLFILFGAAAVLIAMGSGLSGGQAHFLARFATFLDSLPSLGILAVIVCVCAAISFVLYLWSVRIIENKEF